MPLSYFFVYICLWSYKILNLSPPFNKNNVILYPQCRDQKDSNGQVNENEVKAVHVKSFYLSSFFMHYNLFEDTINNESKKERH